MVESPGFASGYFFLGYYFLNSGPTDSAKS